MNNNKEEISELLKSEILVRYYYAAGRLQGSLQDDPEVKEAVKVLKDRDRYNKILSGKKK